MLHESQVAGWPGRTLFDRDGSKVGTIQDVFADERTGAPAWVTVSSGLFGRKHHFVPIADAREVEDGVAVPLDGALVKDAPNVDQDGDLSADDEGLLYRHYGMLDEDPGSGATSGADSDDEDRSAAPAAAAAATGDRDGDDRDRDHDDRDGSVVATGDRDRDEADDRATRTDRDRGVGAHDEDRYAGGRDRLEEQRRSAASGDRDPTSAPGDHDAYDDVPRGGDRDDARATGSGGLIAGATGATAAGAFDRRPDDAPAEEPALREEEAAAAAAAGERAVAVARERREREEREDREHADLELQAREHAERERQERRDRAERERLEQEREREEQGVLRPDAHVLDRDRALEDLDAGSAAVAAPRPATGGAADERELLPQHDATGDADAAPGDGLSGATDHGPPIPDARFVGRPHVDDDHRVRPDRVIDPSGGTDRGDGGPTAARDDTTSDRARPGAGTRLRRLVRAITPDKDDHHG